MEPKCFTLLEMAEDIEHLLEKAEDIEQSFVSLFLECESSAITTPEPVIPGSESFRITSTHVLVPLQTKLDYEVNAYYSLVLQVEDETMALTGSLIIRVGYM